jgi:hypothetical protein
MTIGSTPEAHQDLRKTLRRRISETPILDDPFAGVSPIPAAPKDAKTRMIRDSQSPFIAPPMSDRAGRAQIYTKLITRVSGGQYTLNECNGVK